MVVDENNSFIAFLLWFLLFVSLSKLSNFLKFFTYLGIIITHSEDKLTILVLLVTYIILDSYSIILNLVFLDITIFFVSVFSSAVPT